MLPTDRRVTFMGCPLDMIDMAETIRLAEHAMTTKTRLQHVVVNVAKLVHMQKDKNLRDDVVMSDVINIDGMGVVWGAKLCGFNVPEKVSGADLMDRLLTLCEQKGFRPYILGARPEVLELAVENIKQRHPKIQMAGWHHGYFSRDGEKTVMEKIREAKADCLFIAITSPTKERLMNEYRDMWNIPFMMGVGGSIDIVAGIVSRAPVWMQKYGLEWVWRIIQEPKRMWKRYLVTNSLFAIMLLREIAASRFFLR
jgi:N-acetylglucosaminyldiphosphoundecaprenol N-acetyl-beta-D-mannosaminyltransferase